MRSRLALALLAALIAPDSADAQQLEPGARVRLTAPQYVLGMEVAGSARPTVGTVISVDDVALTLRTARGDTLTYPFSAVRRVEVSAGRMDATRGAVRGGATGTLVAGGTVATALLLVRVIGGPKGPGFTDDTAKLVGGSAVAGGVLGATLGATPRERWVGARRPRAAVGFAPGGGAVLSLSLPL